MRGRVTIDPFNLGDPQALMARVREQLGEPAFAAAWAQGESLPLNQAIVEVDALLAAAGPDDRGVRKDTDRSAH